MSRAFRFNGKPSACYREFLGFFTKSLGLHSLFANTRFLNAFESVLTIKNSKITTFDCSEVKISIHFEEIPAK